MHLNHAQKEAVSHYEGPCMVLAGPGSGKTLTIAKRIEYLIKEYKVRPEEILVITFTKYAANEMKQRFWRVMKSKVFPVTFGTFHGIYYGILKWAYGLNQENLLLEEEKAELIRQIVSAMDWEEDAELVKEEDFLSGLQEEIGNIKNNCQKLESYESERYGTLRFRRIYQQYEETKKKLHKIDFEDMLSMCLALFESRPDILEKWQKRFRFFLVDEFQDINQVQYEVLRMLAAPENHLFVVGDDDQSVYGFRGAKPGIMLDFKKDYPDAKQIVLDVNYRSTAHIVHGALRVISNNKQRYEKKIRAYLKADQTVHVQEVQNPVEESRYVMEKMQELSAQGIAYKDMAVLFRTSMDAGVIAETFAEYQIPFVMREHLQNIYEHFTGQDISAYFHIAVGSKERKHFLRVMNRPNRYVGRDSMESGRVTYESLRNFYCDKQWMQDRIDQFEWDMKMIQNKTPYAAIQYLRKSVGYDQFLKEYTSYRGLNLEEALEALDEIQERSKDCKTLEEWFAHVERYKEMQKEQSRHRGEGEGVALLTMHGAKGLEYDTVFIIEGNEGVTPYKKAQAPEELEEERRLFYVAMTRAKRQLIISYVKEKNGKEKSPSRFVNELFSS